MPLVLASRLVSGLEADTVLLDDVRGAYESTREILRLGHRRIAFLGNLVSVSTAERRFEGFRRALTEAGVELDEGLVRRGQQDANAARIATEELLASPDRPTAIFSANNRNTIGALEAIGAHPDQPPPTLVGFDDVELAHLLRIPLLIVSHDPEELGAAAARMLFDRLDGDPGAAPRLVELPVSVGGVRG
jgi:LacI family transcriptional regulator